MSINVMLVDDDPVLLESLAIILDLDEEINIVGKCHNGDEVFNTVLKNPNIDVILMDIQMPICDGIAGSKKILEVYRDIKIIMLTTFDDDEYVFKALKNGTKGYMLKNSPPDKIIEAIKIVHFGNLIVHPDIAVKLPLLLNEDRKINFDTIGLSDIELNIMKLISKGYSNKEVSEELYLAEGTVKNKITDILNKLDLRDRTQIAIYYLNNSK